MHACCEMGKKSLSSISIVASRFIICCIKSANELWNKVSLFSPYRHVYQIKQLSCLYIGILTMCLLSSEVVSEYLSAVLSDVLHCQREPLPLCLALLQYDKELSAPPHPSIMRLHQYYSRWLPQQCQEELVSF